MAQIYTPYPTSRLHIVKVYCLAIWQNGWVKNIADIYELDRHLMEIVMLEGFGTKAVDNLLSAIDDSKSNALHRLINGLSSTIPK